MRDRSRRPLPRGDGVQQLPAARAERARRRPPRAGRGAAPRRDSWAVPSGGAGHSPCTGGVPARGRRPGGAQEVLAMRYAPALVGVAVALASVAAADRADAAKVLLFYSSRY